MEHVWILVGAGLFTIVTVGFHELLEARRDRAARARDLDLNRKLDDFIRITRAAVNQRTNIEADVRDLQADVRELQAVLVDHADRLDRLDPQNAPSGRPKP